MKITICTNLETLRAIWEDVYPQQDDTIDSEIGREYVKAFSGALVDNIPGCEIAWESDFQYWHGGPGLGFYVVDSPDCGMADDAYHTAAAIARDLAAKMMADHVAATAEEE